MRGMTATVVQTWMTIVTVVSVSLSGESSSIQI